MSPAEIIFMCVFSQILTGFKNKNLISYTLSFPFSRNNAQHIFLNYTRDL